jgi:hypothetical protein
MTNKEKITKKQKNKKHNLRINIYNIITYSEFLWSDFILKKEFQGWGERIFCSKVFGE